MSRLVFGLIAVLTLPACGGGSSGGGSDPDHPLTGTWFGTAYDINDSANYTSIELTFDSDGKLNNVVFGGTERDVTADQVDKSEGFFIYDASNGARVYLRKFNGDSLGYLDSGDIAALMDKGSDSRTTYSLTDMTGVFT
jgi:hypothetical protein